MPLQPAAEERAVIVLKDQRRKYAARLHLLVQRATDIGDLTDVTLFLPTGAIATIRSGDRAASWGVGEPLNVDVAGFETAAEAEAAGNQFVQAILSAAISFDFGLQLRYRTQVPFTVFDRTVSRWCGMDVGLYRSWSQDTVLSEINSALLLSPGHPNLLLAMELFAAANAEPNERVRFIMGVSALEPLAQQRSLGPEVAVFIQATIDALHRDDSVPGHLKASLKGRLQKLKEEGVRQAILRLCDEVLPGDAVSKGLVDDAYNLRSRLLHNGMAGPDLVLATEFRKVSGVLRRIFARELNVELKAAAPPPD